MIYSTRLVAGLVAALILVSGVCPQAAEFTSPTLGTLLQDPRDLQLENIRILQESTLPDGPVLLEVAADLRNLDTGLWSNPGFNMLEAINAGSVAYLGPNIAHAGDIAAGGLAAAGGLTMHVVVGSTDVVAARAEILAGTILSPLGHTESGSIVDQPADLSVENIVIVSETTLADGRVLIRFAADVRNQTSEVVQDITVNLATLSGTIVYEQANSALIFPGQLTANAFEVAPGALYVTVDPSNLASVRADVFNQDALGVFGTELFVFIGPPLGIDEDTENAWSTAQLQQLDTWLLIFTETTPFLEALQPGDLLLEDPGVNRLVTPFASNPYQPGSPDPVLAKYLPLEVVSVTTVGDEVHVLGEQRDLLEIVKSGTMVQDSKSSPYDQPVRDPYDPELENTYTEEEQEEREDLAKMIADQDPRDGRLADLRGMTFTPIVFNESNILDHVAVSGEVMFRSSGLRLEVKIRNFQLQRAIAYIDAGVVMNLVIEVDAKVDTSELEEEEKKKHLKELKLPGISFNLAGVPMEVAPLIYLDAGIEANVPHTLTLPLQSSFIVGIEMGYDRSLISDTSDGFFYEPVTEFIPIRVSDPTVFDDLAVSAGVWVELGVSIIGSIVPVEVEVDPNNPGAEIPLSPLNFGPTLAVRASAEMTVAPLADPWWELDFDVELIGRFYAKILGQTFVDVEGSLDTFELADLDRSAGGPLITLPGLNDISPSNAGLKPLSARNVRWARAFQPKASFGGFNQAFTFFMSEGEEEFMIVGGAVTSGATIAKFTQEGDLVWIKDLGISPLAMYGAALDNGNFVVVGKRANDVVLAQFDAAGNRSWYRSFLPANLSYSLKDLAVSRDAGGAAAAIMLVGFVNQGVITESDPWVTRFDLAGNVQWSQVYGRPGDDQVHGVMIPDNTTIVLGGFTAADVAAPGQGVPDSENVLKNATSSGLLMKLDATDGSVDWAHAFASRWGMVFEDVLQSPEGMIYAGGACSRIVTQTRPANLFSKFNSEGELLDHVLIGDDPDAADLLPNAGNTPYDTVARLVWAENGLLACGTTGLGAERAAWIMGLSEELGVKFCTVVDGVDADVCLDLAAGSDGIGVVGYSRSVYPWAAPSQSVPLLMKLPWEGVMRFHEDTGVETITMPPQIFHSSASLEFQMLSSVETPGAAPIAFSSRQSPVTFTPVALAMNPGGTVTEPTDGAAVTLLALEHLTPAVIADFDDWIAYHNLQGVDAERDADTDGDGLANVFEAFFGRNPFVAETESPITISAGEVNGQSVVVIQFDRSTFTQSLGVTFESSEDLDNWLGATGLTETVQPLSPTQERVKLVAPQDLPLQFYQLVASVASAASSQ